MSAKLTIGKDDETDSTTGNDSNDDDENHNDEDEDEQDDTEYEVDYIVDSRYRTTRGRQHLEYLIHWKGYKKSDRSWTDAEQFDNDDPPVIAFYDQNPKKPGKKAKRQSMPTPGPSTDSISTPSPPEIKASAPIGSISKKTPTPKNPVSSPKSTSQTRPLAHTKSFQGDLRNWFANPDKAQSKGKENARIPSTSEKSKPKAPEPEKPKAPAVVKEKPKKESTPPPKKKKMVIVSDDENDEDFVMDVEGKESEAESSFSADEEESGTAEGDGLESEDDEDVVGEQNRIQLGRWTNDLSSREERDKGQEVWRLGQQDQGDKKGRRPAVSVASPFLQNAADTVQWPIQDWCQASGAGQRCQECCQESQRRSATHARYRGYV